MPNWTAAQVRSLLRLPKATDDKYSRGVLGVYTGSRHYPGAAVLGVEAAARTGIGMIRYRGEAAAEVLARRPETVTVSGRVQAWLIGSGMPQLMPTDPVLTEAVRSGVPLVLDAGALHTDVLAESSSARSRILTPHAGEAAQLLDCTRAEVEADPVASAHRLAERYQATVLLKGNLTHVAAVGGGSIQVGPATPWLATAGTGDVLAGILGALVASAPAADLAALAAAAAWMHAAAADLASGGAPIVALDVAEALPQLIRTLLK